MKSLISIFLAIVTFLTGCEPEVKRVESSPEAASAQEATRPGGKGRMEHIKCPKCAGEKFLVPRGGVKVGDFKQGCPICNARGFRDLVVPGGKKVCPDCKGMGNVMDSSKANTGKAICSKCSGFGVVPAGAK